MHPDRRKELLPLVRPAGLAPVLEALHDKLAVYGVPKGSITIETPEASDALEDLIGKRVPPGKGVRVAEVDRLVRERTPFASLEEAVEVYRGAPIVRPKEERERVRAAREKAVRRCFALLPGLGLSPGAFARVVSWLREAEPSLRAACGRWGEDTLVDAVSAVARAFDRMPERNGPIVYLAELATHVARDAHAFDPGQPGHTLLFRALEYHYPATARREKRGSAEWKANLLSEAGIARDPVSVRVDTFGLAGDTAYLQALREAALTRSINLDDFQRIGSTLKAWDGVAFVVENPTVFMALVAWVREFFVVEKHPTLICTNGNLNMADKAVLGALCARGAHLFYAGDFDVRGAQIAADVLERYAGAASPWRMAAADYRDAIGEGCKTFDPAALQRIARHFPDLIAEMSARRQAAHHESLIAKLKEDVQRFVTRGETPPRGGDGPAPYPRYGTQPVH